MQLGLRSSSNNLIKPASLARNQITKTQEVKQNFRTKENNNARFPEAALLSTRPVRYNIQLNQQLTSVQLSDNYLSQVENKLLQLSHTARNGAKQANSNQIAQQQLNDLSTILEKREKLSANTVDRQLNAVLDSKPTVNFTLKGAESWLQNPESETLIFVLNGQKRDISAVKFKEDSTPSEALRHLNLGLGKFNIHGRLQDNQVVFSVDEQQWANVNKNLSVRGEGHRYPEGQFISVHSQAEPSIKDTVDSLINSPGILKVKAKEIQQTLEHVNLQRRALSGHKDNVQQRIDGMATFQQKGMAVQASLVLKAQLAGANNNYEHLLQATAGQANIHRNVVKNLLSDI